MEQVKFVLFLSVLQVVRAVEYSVLKSSTLEQTHVIFRHGARNPHLLFNGDPNPPESWPLGLGQLRKEGIQQSYDIGRFLRDRYSEFLPKAYHPDDVYVRSTDKDRTLMTAQAVLSSLYPPHGDQIWRPSLLWQPIPVHTVTLKTDNMMNYDTYCMRYYELQNKAAYESPTGKNLHDEHNDFMEDVKKKSGLSYPAWHTVWEVYDTLRIERLYNRTWPAWVTEEMYERMGKIFPTVIAIRNAYQPEMQRLRSGIHIKEIMDQMDKMVNNNTEVKKAYLYSSHDMNIASILHTLGYWDNIVPPYACVILFELHKENGEYFVRIYYKNDTINDWETAPMAVSLPGCDTNCPMEKFKAHMQQYSLDAENFPRACETSETSTGNSTYSNVFSLVCLVILSLVSAVILW